MANALAWKSIAVLYKQHLEFHRRNYLSTLKTSSTKLQALDLRFKLN